MNPDDLIKAAPAIAKGAAALAATVPFTAIMKRMLGPAADEVAEQLRTEIKVYRYGRTLKLLEKAERMANEAGFSPKAVPIKLLFPLLEGASLEEDEGLHDMWAALLTNASMSESSDMVRPGFIAVLRQMASDEAAILNFLFDEANKPKPFGQNGDQTFGRLSQLYAGLGKKHTQLGDATDLMVCLASLEAANLIEKDKNNNALFGLTFRGGAFVTACRPPQPEK